MSNMSFMEKLLDGVEVEWKTLGEIATIGTGSSNTNEAVLDGQYPFFVRSQEPRTIDSFEFDETAIITAGDGVGVGKVFHYVSGKYALHQRAYRIVIRDDHINSKFLFYYIRNNFAHYLIKTSVHASVTSLRKPMFEKYPIPIISLVEQGRIVTILDKLDASTNSISEGLHSEIELHKKQYNYYRDQLLSFEEGEVEWKTLGEVAGYSKTRICFDKLNKTNYAGVDNLLQNRAGKKESSYMPTEGNLTEYRNGDILIGNIRPYLKKIWHADRLGGTNGDVLVIRLTDEAVKTRYLYQVLADDKFFDYNMQHSKGAKMPRGNKIKIMEYLIPIPPLAEQERIVGILDKFDILTNSISEDLLREIELRQKQYEYYRDLLLSFPKPEVEA
ncbi:restriction endonuclease subunit S [Xenorhabdus bovienii]|uniref:restriction endonuclease subunit S n=1 Tax=Xenorhabdus bovienii TaxID=40576 RepID=UPI003DA35A5F